ncbi:MAG: hypothetical protein J0M26_07720 [Planctomycetes bacterium]|nr:hypothetical protein [Planctomycetota bacterium]
MDFHQWQQQLRNELYQRHIPADCAERLMNELVDHYLDLQEATQMKSDATTNNDVIKMLGDPKSIATATAQIPRRSWAARHPLLSYLILPPLMSLVVLALLILVDVFLLVPAVRGRTLETDPWLASACLVLGPLHVIVATSLIALWSCRSVARSGRSKLWGIAACLVVAILGAYTSVNFAAPTAVPGSGRLSLGFGFPLPVFWMQAVTPLIIGGFFYALRRATPSIETESENTPLSRAA